MMVLERWPGSVPFAAHICARGWDAADVKSVPCDPTQRGWDRQNDREGMSHLPLQIAAHIVRNRVSKEAEDIDVASHARICVVRAFAPATVPVDVAVEPEQPRCGRGVVRLDPDLVGPTVDVSQRPDVARVPVAMAVPAPPRVVKELPAVVIIPVGSDGVHELVRPARAVVEPPFALLPAFHAPQQ
eukprot:184531-Prymnesium_polylepis.1